MKKGYSLVEIMVVLAALAGVALLVTKIGQNSQNIQNESIVMNDYNELVRDTHFLMGNAQSCKVSLEGVTFKTVDYKSEIPNIELWTADSKGLSKKKKLVSKGEKFKTLTIENVTLKIDEPSVMNLPDGALVNTTAGLKITMGKERPKYKLGDIEHNFNINFIYNAAKGEGVIVDCGSSSAEDRQFSVWCGNLTNPCGTESAEVVAIGKYKNGKFTGIFQLVKEGSEKFCLAARNHDASLRRCD